MELLIGLFVVTYWACAAPRAIADAVATWRASKAGEFDFIDKDRERRATRQERWGKAWQATRANRNRQAGGDGNYRPGAGAYFGDLYHGFWERGLEKRHAKADARGPYVYDPDAPTFGQRVTAAVENKVQRLRETRMPESVRRAGRLLVDPVGEKRPEPQRRPDDLAEATYGRSDVPSNLGQQAGALFSREFGEQRGTRDRNEAQRLDVVDEDELDADDEDTVNINGGNNVSAEAAVVAGSAVAAGAAATEVNTNEDARQAFAAMAAAAAEAADAISALEVAKAKMAAAANGAADGMSGKRFDSLATQAATEAADAINVGTLADWSEKVDVVHASAERGLASLNKYIDSEDMVASNNIDATTLASTH